VEDDDVIQPLCASGDTTPPNKAPKRKDAHTVPKMRISTSGTCCSLDSHQCR
jgi:hypothetical protein